MIKYEDQQEATYNTKFVSIEDDSFMDDRCSKFDEKIQNGSTANINVGDGIGNDSKQQIKTEELIKTPYIPDKCSIGTSVMHINSLTTELSGMMWDHKNASTIKIPEFQGDFHNSRMHLCDTSYKKDLIHKDIKKIKHAERKKLNKNDEKQDRKVHKSHFLLKGVLKKIDENNTSSIQSKKDPQQIKNSTGECEYTDICDEDEKISCSEEEKITESTDERSKEDKNDTKNNFSFGMLNKFIRWSVNAGFSHEMTSSNNYLHNLSKILTKSHTKPSFH